MNWNYFIARYFTLSIKTYWRRSRISVTVLCQPKSDSSVLLARKRRRIRRRKRTCICIVPYVQRVEYIRRLMHHNITQFYLFITSKIHCQCTEIKDKSCNASKLPMYSALFHMDICCPLCHHQWHTVLVLSTPQMHDFIHLWHYALPLLSPTCSLTMSLA